MNLTCLCCGHSQEFPSLRAAYEAGWDTPDKFAIAPLCDLCPTTLYARVQDGLLIGEPGQPAQHGPVHERWAREGRPDHFTIPSCT